MAIWLVTKHKETMTIPIRDLDTILTISVTMEYAAIMTNTLAILEQATKQIDHQENPVTTETKTQETLIAK
jgi:hypothetical protein